MKRIKKSNNAQRKIRHRRVRARVRGTVSIPRLSVFRSHQGVVLQLIDDETGNTLCQVDSKTIKSAVQEGKSAKVAMGFLAGKQLAEVAKAKGIIKVVFDRGGYQYHGRVAAVAEGARAGGLQF